MPVLSETRSGFPLDGSWLTPGFRGYRFRLPYYIVDRLFGAAELCLGGGCTVAFK